MLCSGEQDSWSSNGIAYGSAKDLYSLHERAAAYIHQRVLEKQQ
jgi:hypothetical protein